MYTLDQILAMTAPVNAPDKFDVLDTNDITEFDNGAVKAVAAIAAAIPAVIDEQTIAIRTPDVDALLDADNDNERQGMAALFGVSESPKSASIAELLASMVGGKAVLRPGPGVTVKGMLKRSKGNYLLAGVAFSPAHIVEVAANGDLIAHK